jgi:prolyl-tRNA editing enzyme YbaK/EbsC (Cys-tRNA(Pro) deacylase)
MLDAAGVAYRHVVHGPTRTSEESAAARGEPIEVGAKAMVLKVGDAFGLFVLSAARKLDSGAIKKRIGVKSVRFATPEELLELTGLVPGSVPPFGRPVLPFDLNLESGVAALPKVAFNAGSLTESLVLATPDYLKVAKPVATFGFAV